MNLGQLAAADVRRRLTGAGLCLRTGPFSLRIRSDVDAVQTGVALLYADHALVDEREFCDFALDLMHVRGLRRWLRPQVRVYHDHLPMFEPMPLGHALPLLEWSLNWCTCSQAHQYLIFHAATIERHGHAVVMPAPPGSGKSTLCAALVHQGWRLLSDELALVDLATGLLTPIARPVNLKNRSIDIVRALGPGVQIGPVCTDTAKGDVAHMRPPADSVAALQRPARPWMLVFPHYQEGADLAVRAPGKAHAFAEMVRHSFNFALLAGDGFRSIGRLMDQVRVFDMRYGALEQVLPEIQRLWEMPR